jgi:hypothetical protein
MEDPMTAAYVAATAVTAFACAFAAYMNFVRHEFVIAVADAVQVPRSWMLPLGTLLAAAAVGLLLGFAVPLIGTAAAVGLVLYFLCALGAHLRVRDNQIGGAVMFLSLAITTLVLGLAYRGPW